MSFPDLTALGFSAIEDSKFLQDAGIDGAIRYETQGGLTVTRARFTRPPPRMITTGFSWISQADFAIFQSYYLSQHGGAGIFSYVHPSSGETLSVRFEKDYKTAYKGAGSNYLWEVSDIVMRTT